MAAIGVKVAVGLRVGAAVAGIREAVGRGVAVEEVGDAPPPQAARTTRIASKMAIRGGHAIFFVALWEGEQAMCNPYYRSPSKGQAQGPGANRGYLCEEAIQVSKRIKVPSCYHTHVEYTTSPSMGAPGPGSDVAAGLSKALGREVGS